MLILEAMATRDTRTLAQNQFKNTINLMLDPKNAIQIETLSKQLPSSFYSKIGTQITSDIWKMFFYHMLINAW